jgi:hypothetical protein
LTTRVVVPVELENEPLPAYVPEIASLPAGAAEEVHDPLPLDNVAVQSDVDPVEKVTDPLRENPVILGVTVAE